MADNSMMGVMALPQSAESGPAPTGMAAVDQIRQNISPSEISSTLLDTAEQADPATVADFKNELAGLQLPPELLDMLNTLAEAALDDPDNYPAIRQQFLSQGIPPDLLPETFDATFFGALNMAVDQLRQQGQQAVEPPQITSPEQIFTMKPQGYARGGLAQSIAQAGRNGDTMLAHISPQEAALLRSRGGSGTINPVTGLPEYFSLGGVFKKIGSAIKKFASSTIGKIVIGTALFIVAGPAAAAMFGPTAAPALLAATQGFAAGAGTTLLGGGNLRDALKAGAIGGLTAGAIKGVTQGSAAFRATAPAVPAPVVDVVPGSGPGVSNGVPTIDQLTGNGINSPSQAMNFDLNGQLPTDPMTQNVQAGMRTYNNLTDLSQRPSHAPLPRETILAESQAAAMPRAPVPELSLARGYTPVQNSAVMPSPASPAGAGTGTGVGASSQTPSFEEVLNQGGVGAGAGAGSSSTSSGINSLFDNRPVQAFKNTFMPDTIRANAQSTALEKTIAQFSGNGSAYSPEMVTSIIDGTYTGPPSVFTQQVTDAFTKNANPGFLRTWGPAAAASLGVMGLMGGFDEQPAEKPAGFDGPTGIEYLAQHPELNLNFGGTQVRSAYNPYASYGSTPVRKASGGTVHFPRKNGHINGPGTGTSDDVPAMLSDGEFVFTSKAVRNAGGGSRRAGAQKMMALMRHLEKRNG